MADDNGDDNVEPMKPRKTVHPQSLMPHKELAKRLQQAIDGNRNIPPPNKGRLVWFVEQLEAHFGIETKPETVRKWLAGMALPRKEAMAALAELLQVDQAWLALGKAAELDNRQQKLRDAAADGVVNVVVGFLQMHGGNPAFPTATDTRAKDQHIDAYAIIRGAQYAFHMALAIDDDTGWRFAIPVGAENNFILGVIPIGDTAIDIIEIDHDGIELRGTRKGGFIEVRTSRTYASGDHQFNRIRNFRERL